MNEPMLIIVIFLICYLLGSFQSSYIFGKTIKKVDIRNYGSGNPGATNAIRVFGFKFGMVCLLIDALKGALAILLVQLILGDENILIELLAGFFVIIGHNYPFYMGFKGGKGVAATIGIMLMINWKVALIAAIPSIIMMVAFRIMSVASLTFQTVCFIALVLVNITSENLYSVALAAALYPLMSFLRHRKNIVRVFYGEEPRLWGKGKAEIKIDEPNNKK
ncbi:MAG: glycerol-3-phosphate 1-O-acyltransferase PlsY [Oscillospiraceae bacterium]|nr:glycerol-3-phosphate 1-O-acyltransferase PlsY [Oscillospiraceae bacterium]